jgi:hypothetical protein
MHRYLPAAALLLLLAACGGQAGPAPGDPTTAPVTAPTPAPGQAYPEPGAGQAYPAPGAGQAYPAPDTSTSDATRLALETAARDRLAQHLGVQPGALSLLRSDPREWPSTALGCPDPGQVYAEYIVPGFLMEFSDGSTSYAVHTSLSERPGEPMVYCDAQRPVDLSLDAAPPTSDPAAQAMVELARQDLANELEIDAAEVTVMTVSPIEWPDSSLGCPQPDASYLQVLTPGFKIELQALGQLYTYHTDQQSVLVRCQQP